MRRTRIWGFFELAVITDRIYYILDKIFPNSLPHNDSFKAMIVEVPIHVLISLLVNENEQKLLGFNVLTAIIRYINF